MPSNKFDLGEYLLECKQELEKINDLETIEDEISAYNLKIKREIEQVMRKPLMQRKLSEQEKHQLKLIEDEIKRLDSFHI